jgi:hypothetical protein
VVRRWRLNPPPNWPVPPGAELDPDWRPDPTWGPPPVGWLLWHRERTALSVNQLRLAVTLLAATAVLLGGGLIKAVPVGPATADPAQSPTPHRLAVPSVENASGFEPWVVNADQARTADVLMDGVPRREPAGR